MALSRPGWVAWGVGGLVAGEITGAVVLSGRVDPVVVVTVFYVLTTGLVGTILASRVPRHPVGWLLLAASLSYATGGLLVSYTEVALFERPGALPISPWVVWLGNWTFGLGVGISATFLLLLFPTGRLPSPRWRPVAWAAGLGLGALLGGVALSPAPFEGLPMDNPIAVDGAETLLLVLEGGGFYLLMLAMVASVGSLVLRFRSARGVERQQLKWVALSVLVVGIGLLTTTVWELANGADEISDDVENIVVSVSLGLVPLAMGVAILRYRLYDIDRIISRTVSYGIVTGMLVGLYGALVFVLRDLLPLSGDLAVAGSTLAVAALFDPARRRIQSAVDRRFNRSRYDSSQAMERFGQRLRSEIGLSEVGADLESVVGNTLQPTSISLWIPGERS